MQPTGQYQCVQCKLQFTDIREWREGSGTGPTLQQPGHLQEQSEISYCLQVTSAIE
jgi:hypothetical protein